MSNLEANSSEKMADTYVGYDTVPKMNLQPTLITILCISVHQGWLVNLKKVGANAQSSLEEEEAPKSVQRRLF